MRVCLHTRFLGDAFSAKPRERCKLQGAPPKCQGHVHCLRAQPCPSPSRARCPWAHVALSTAAQMGTCRKAPRSCYSEASGCAHLVSLSRWGPCEVVSPVVRVGKCHAGSSPREGRQRCLAFRGATPRAVASCVRLLHGAAVPLGCPPAPLIDDARCLHPGPRTGLLKALAAGSFPEQRAQKWPFAFSDSFSLTQCCEPLAACGEMGLISGVSERMG